MKFAKEKGGATIVFNVGGLISQAAASWNLPSGSTGAEGASSEESARISFAIGCSSCIGICESSFQGSQISPEFAFTLTQILPFTTDTCYGTDAQRCN